MNRTQQHKIMNIGSAHSFYSHNHLCFSEKLPAARQFVHYSPNNRQLNKIKTEPSDQEQLAQLNRSIYKMKKALFNSTEINTVKSILFKKQSIQTDCTLPSRCSVIKKLKPTPISENCHTQRKIRESNSTQCQSPKAEKRVLNRKVMEYRMIKLLGKGRFGQVYMAKHQKTGFLGALKIIRKTQVLNQDKDKKQRILNQIVSQIKLQSYLTHPNLIRLYDFFSDQQNVYLFQQLASDGQLYQLLQKNGPFSQETTSMVMREIISGVQYMHSKSIIHRDIKLQNIVFTHGMAKICDFGWSVRETKQFRTTLCGTPLYLSPQILRGRKYNQKIDIWALGNIAHEMATNNNPFGIQRKQELDKIITMDFQMKAGSPELRSFVNFILKKNPAKRPDADIVLQHPFIKKYAEIETSEELCNLIYAYN